MYKKIKEIDIEEIKIAIKETKSKRAALRYLGCNDANGNELILLGKIANENCIDVGYFSYSFDFSKISDVIEKSYGFLDIAKNLGIVDKSTKKISSRLISKIKNHIENEKIDISHFRYQNGSRFSKTDDEVFCKNGDISTDTVKKRFLKKVDYVCQECNISHWNGKKISLQMDHIDGDCCNHLFSNLRLLCPNCHSQTDTFARKNRKVVYDGYQRSKSQKTIDTQNK